nr:carbon starvation protein A [Glycomyces albidus]
MVLAISVLALFACGFLFYARYLASKVYRLDPAYVTPAHRFNDGVDFVPTNRHVLFGHHFTSVAGAAPIVGPAIAVYWGWLPALIWIVVGTIVAAGVHDMGALVLSVRHKAKGIGTLTKDVVGPRAGTLFLVIIFFLLTLVNAVFAVVIGNLLVAYPGSVIPIFAEIPIAVAIGFYVYKRRGAALVPSLLGVAALYVLIWIGNEIPVDITPLADAIGVDNPRNVWIVILFVYTFIAARIPVWMLLQPRDYINSHQLFVALALVLLGVGVGWNTVVAPALNTVPEDSPSMWPFLFITVACGAISGFHCLVSSGTTSKQLDKETDAKYVGYGGALGEGTLALCSILAVSAGVAASRADWDALYPDFATASGGATSNFVGGIAVFANNLGIPLDVAAIFAAVVVISFAATTMDTGVRLQRYVVQEIAELAGWRRVADHLTLATAIAVAIPLALALMPGGEDAGYAFGVLWQLFGTTNQLLAGLALAVIAVWVTKRRSNPIAILVPLVFLVGMTVWALIVNLGNFIEQGEWVLAPLDAIIFALAVWMIVEAARGLVAAWGDRDGPARTAPSEDLEEARD